MRPALGIGVLKLANVQKQVARNWLIYETTGLKTADREPNAFRIGSCCGMTLYSENGTGSATDVCHTSLRWTKHVPVSSSQSHAA